MDPATGSGDTLGDVEDTGTPILPPEEELKALKELQNKLNGVNEAMVCHSRSPGLSSGP